MRYCTLACSLRMWKSPLAAESCETPGSCSTTRSKSVWLPWGKASTCALPTVVTLAPPCVKMRSRARSARASPAFAAATAGLTGPPSAPSGPVPPSAPVVPAGVSMPGAAAEPAAAAATPVSGRGPRRGAGAVEAGSGVALAWRAGRGTDAVLDREVGLGLGVVTVSEGRVICASAATGAKLTTSPMAMPWKRMWRTGPMDIVLDRRRNVIIL